MSGNASPPRPTAADLRADCSQCFALCCVAPAFAKSADFAINKPAGQPCPNLKDDFRCGIHDRLRESGFPGCVVFDCSGAGQKVAQVTFGGRDWRSHPETAREMFDVFSVMRQLHELTAYLLECLDLNPNDGETSAALDEIVAVTYGKPAEVLTADVAKYRQRVNELTTRASKKVRQGGGVDMRGKDLMGASLKGADLRGASLRGAYLIGADLRNADLRLADVIGADFRNANLRGANLSTSIFLTQQQIDAASGDGRTKIPERLHFPPHWNVGGGR